MTLADDIQNTKAEVVKVNYWSGFDIYHKKVLIFLVRGLKLTDKTRT